MSVGKVGFGVAFIALVLSCVAARAQEPGDRPPPEASARLREQVGELEQALAAKDEDAVYSAVERCRKVLGPYAGVPESPERHFKPIETSAPDVDKLVAAWEEFYSGPLAEHGARSELAKNNHMELRESAYIAMSCIAFADAVPARADEYVARAREELDYLLTRQHSSGLFPYPADPGGSAPTNMIAAAEQYRREHPELVEGSYLIVENQFDTGCCAYALSEGYRVTRDLRYLEAAKKAGEWALGVGLSTNWNYNVFSVWQLAKLYSLTGETKYLDSAVEKATIGVIPGLMDSGHWVDQHNAKQSYHWIMVRGLNELLRVMPADHPRYDDIKSKMFLAADTRAREIVRDGASNIESALLGLSLILGQFGPNNTWETAANVIVNAMCAAGKPNSVALPEYIRYRTMRERSPESSDAGDHSAEEIYRRGSRVIESMNNVTDFVERRELSDIVARIRTLYEDRRLEEAGRFLTYVEEEMARYGAHVADIRRQPTQELNPDQGSKLEIILPQMRDAMIAKDGAKIRALVSDAVEIMGDEAGKPEEGLVIRTGFSIEPQFGSAEAERLWQKQLDSCLEDPRTYFDQISGRKTTLRHFAWRMFSLVALHERTENAPTKARLAEAIRYGADMLLAQQASNGVFGFPYEPESQERLRRQGARIVEEGRARGVKMVENGWIIEDLGDGGLQFDNGLCGSAIVMAYHALGDEKYLDSAKRCAQYVRRIPVVLNWNYNAFSAWFLANLYGVTRDSEILSVLAEKLALGVLPGMMDNGRYFDAHNAKTVYHLIIIESLLAASQVMPSDHPMYAETVRAAKKTIENLAREVLDVGPNHLDRSLGVFSRYLMRFVPNDDVHKALGATINAILGPITPESIGSGDMEMVAYQLGFYLDYLKSEGKL